MSDNYQDAFDNRKFSSAEMKSALNDALSSLGSTWREMIFEELAKSSINFDSNAGYSINDVRPYLYAVFEQDMGEVILNKARRALQSDE